jgi:hypothetical protein
MLSGALLVDGLYLFVAQVFDPGAIVQRLSDHFPWRATALKFNQYQFTLGIDCQEIGVLAKGSKNLPSDDHNVGIDKSRVPGKDILQQSLVMKRRRLNRSQLPVNPPNP